MGKTIKGEVAPIEPTSEVLDSNFYHKDVMLEQLDGIFNITIGDFTLTKTGQWGCLNEVSALDLPQEERTALKGDFPTKDAASEAWEAHKSTGIHNFSYKELSSPALADIKPENGK